jgi:galactonate dehydratase
MKAGVYVRITNVRSITVGNPWKNWVYVIVETDEGITGLGEATKGLSTKPIEGWIAELEPLYAGLDPRNVHAVRDALYKGLYLTTNPAVSGIELACWDILGKSLGVPVWQLLGGQLRREVPAYANGWYQGPRDPVFFADRAQEVHTLGYAALKFDPFGDAYGDLSPGEMRRSVEIVAAVRAAVGDEVQLMIEAHDRFHVTTAIAVGRALAEYAPTWLEAPVLSTDADALRRVVEAVPVPVSAGERSVHLHEFDGILQAGVGVLQPELLNTGLTGGIRAASLAESRQVPVAPHNAQSPYMTVVNLHLAAITPNFLIQEHFDDFAVDCARDLLRGTAVRHGSQLAIPDGPGFGVTLDEHVAAKHPYSDRNFLRLFEAGWERRNQALA